MPSAGRQGKFGGAARRKKASASRQWSFLSQASGSGSNGTSDRSATGRAQRSLRSGGCSALMRKSPVRQYDTPATRWAPSSYVWDAVQAKWSARAANRARRTAAMARRTAVIPKDSPQRHEGKKKRINGIKRVGHPVVCSSSFLCTCAFGASSHHAARYTASISARVVSRVHPHQPLNERPSRRTLSIFRHPMSRFGMPMSFLRSIALAARPPPPCRSTRSPSRQFGDVPYASSRAGSL